MRNKRPSTDDMQLAAEWLEAYEDEHDGGDSAKACARVADWLRNQVEAAILRKECRARRVPVAAVRKRLAVG